MEMGTTLDLAIIVIYFFVVLGFGSLFGRFTRTTSDFFFSGQRLSWWLCAFSCIATVVGSYSFIKYSDVAYRFGLASTMTYTNDWFLMPFWMFGWLPIIYFSRVKSIPEYFERRFDRRSRLAATVIIIIYMVGYVGINFYTLGVAMNAILGWGIYPCVITIAAICAVYVTAGGQMAVIMTDLLQGVLLLIAGYVLLYLGIDYLGGWGNFWDGLPLSHKFPFTDFNEPPNFNAVGIFWQDGFGSTLAFYFMNQGLILRFLSLKSVQEGRKAIAVVALVFMPITTIAVCNAGWIGRAMVTYGLLPTDIDSKKVFVIVSNLICQPGVFGIIMAALTAALMSTVDTLINAISSIWVNDIWQPYIRPKADDKHYLNVARVSSIAITFVGLALVPLFKSFKSIYAAHGAFTAAITPPMLIAIFLGILWKRYNAKAAFWTIVLGTVGMFLSIMFPDVITPLAHGVSAEGGYKYMRAFFGLALSLLIALLVARATKPQAEEAIAGLTIWSLKLARFRFKGGEPNETPSKPIYARLRSDEAVGESEALLSPDTAARLNALAGDRLFIADKRWWWGGLKSVHAILRIVDLPEDQAIKLHPRAIQFGHLNPMEMVKVERII